MCVPVPPNDNRYDDFEDSGSGYWYALDPANGANSFTDSDLLPDSVEDTDETGTYTSGDYSSLIDADTDDDGLDDYEEYLNGTNPKDKDTDDVDGDGLRDLNGVKGLEETNPHDLDTDNDGLPDGWIDGWGTFKVN